MAILDKMLERLGEAGTGEVFEAEDARVPRVVALKFLLSGALDDKKRKGRVHALVLVPTVPGTPGLPCRRRSHRVSASRGTP